MVRLALISLMAAALPGLVAVPAAALTPQLPSCVPSEVAGSPEPWLSYEPFRLGNGFVEYRPLASDMATSIVLEHCPTRMQLVVRTPAGEGEAALAASELYTAMVEGEAAYTMEQMRDALRGIGAEVSLGRVDYESCACGTFAGR